MNGCYANPRLAGASNGRAAVAVIYMPSNREILPYWAVGDARKWENGTEYHRLLRRAAAKIKARYPDARLYPYWTEGES